MKKFGLSLAVLLAGAAFGFAQGTADGVAFGTSPATVTRPVFSSSLVSRRTANRSSSTM